MIEDIKLDKRIWIKKPREREAKKHFVGNVYMPPESKNAIKEMQRKFGEVAVKVHKQKRQGKVVQVRDINPTVGKAS